MIKVSATSKALAKNQVSTALNNGDHIKYLKNQLIEKVFCAV